MGGEWYHKVYLLHIYYFCLLFLALDVIWQRFYFFVIESVFVPFDVNKPPYYMELKHWCAIVHSKKDLSLFKYATPMQSHPRLGYTCHGKMSSCLIFKPRRKNNNGML